MNVIIRLQNLPWSANATDIRNFFKGLMIPEGGVHIVGGENGDAFIAFSTDEDARQAMQLNGGKIKETQVSLLLSSRAEMQKVIEKARQVSSSPFMNKISATQASTAMSAAAIANQFAKKMPEVPGIAPQPPVISLTNFLTQSMQQQGQQNPVAAQQMNMISAYQTMPPNDIPGIRGSTGAAFPSIPLGLPQNAAAAAAAASYYASLMDPSYANALATVGMNVKKDNNKREDVNQAAFTYNSDPRNQALNSNDRNPHRRQRSRSLDRKQSRRSRSNSREFYDSDKDGKDGGSRRRASRFSAASERSDAPNMATMLPNLKNKSAGYSIPPPAASSNSNVWDNPPPMLFGSDNTSHMNSINAFSSFGNGNNAQPPTRHYQTENNSNDSSSFGNIGTCVKVANVDNETFYSDLRKFFAGLPIGNNDIKFLQDNKGNRTGVVVIRFLSSDSKKKALTKSLWQLKSTQVMITSITEEDFESGMMSKAPNRQTNSNNFRNDDRNERDRFSDRSNDRDSQNRNFNRNDGNNRNNRYDDRPQNNRDQGGNFRKDQNKNFKNEELEKPKYEPDKVFTVLLIDDIPRTANEPDICEAFPNILSIVIDRYKAFVKFASHDAARVTLENRYIHYIRNKRVFLEASSIAQFDELARKLGKFDNPETIADGGNNGCENNFNGPMNDDSNSRESSRNRDQKPFESRDPRQRNFGNDRPGGNEMVNNDRFGGNGPPPNFLNTDCIIIKNMEPSTTIEDVEIFFKDIGIYKMRVHILLDKKGSPCGDCFVEFKYPNDSQRAVSKNSQMLKQNRVQIMQIPREQVEAVLSSFGGGGNGGNSGGGPGKGNNNDDLRPQGRQNRSDWAPPSDFGSPGCVIMMSNLSYKAEIEDIIEELSEFDLRPDQIIRRFNDNGQPTGNACINFNSPDDADMALEKYHSAKILNRPVWLKRM